MDEVIIRLAPEGITVSGRPDRALDVLFDERRVWSFRADHAGTVQPGGARGADVWTVPWPEELRRFLHGSTEVTVRDPGRTVLAQEEIRFTDDDRRVRVQDREGRLLVVDSKGRLTLPFEADTESTGALLAATHTVLDLMESRGLEGFLAYGTLLGAVREGQFIGHDNDVDLGYVSAKAAPVEVVLESLRLERALVRAGMHVERYSGAGLKVFVEDETGVRRGLDIFGGFWHGDRLAFLGEIYTPFEREWITPRSTVTLAGHEFPAPAVPERLLEQMYGPGWRVPDPTFAFDPETTAREVLGRWFRGIREGRNRWDRWYYSIRNDRPYLKPHHIARLVHRAEPGATIIDVGCGRGQDASFFASERHRTIGLDYSLKAVDHHLDRAALHGWPLTVHTVNFLELRHSLSWGARLAREIEGPRAVLARHFVNATPQRGREGLFRFSSLVLRGGGRLYLEFFASEEPRDYDREDLVWEVDHREIVELAERHGGTVEDISWFSPNWFEMPWLTGGWDPKPRGCRMTVSWT